MRFMQYYNTMTRWGFTDEAYKNGVLYMNGSPKTCKKIVLWVLSGCKIQLGLSVCGTTTVRGCLEKWLKISLGITKSGNRKVDTRFIRSLDPGCL